MLEVNEVFERDYDQPAYEAKIGDLAREARNRARKAGEQGRWNEAVRKLRGEDHYLLVLIAGAPRPSESIVADRVKLVGTALLVCLLLIAVVFLFSSR